MSTETRLAILAVALAIYAVADVVHDIPRAPADRGSGTPRGELGHWLGRPRYAASDDRPELTPAPFNANITRPF
jgi:hypothetical protein